MEKEHGIRHGNGILEQLEQLNRLSHSPNLGSEITSWSIEFDMPHGEVATCKKPTLDSTVNNVLDSPSNKAFFPVFFGAKVLSHRDSVFPSTQSNAWSSDVLIQHGMK